MILPLLVILVGGTAFAAYEEGGAVNTYGDAWVLFRSTSYDNPVFESKKTDSAFFYRVRAGLYGSIDERVKYKFRFTTNGTGTAADPYGIRFGDTDSAWDHIRLEHGYLSYQASDQFTIYAGRVPTRMLSNDLVFDTGWKRGYDTATDGLWFNFDFSEQTSLWLGWGRLWDTPGNASRNDYMYGQLKQKFGDQFWGYVGAVNFACQSTGSNDPLCNPAEEDYTAFFVKASYDFTPEFNWWAEFLGSNGQIGGNKEVSDSDSSAWQVGATYKVNDQVTLSAEYAAIGGSSVNGLTQYTVNDYVLSNLALGPSGSADADLVTFNFRIDYAVSENNTVNLDYTFGDEQDVTNGNTGSGFLLSWTTKFG